MSTPMFTIGASNSEDKMDMSLDQIIKQTKGTKPRRPKLTTSPTTNKGSLRKREMANKAVKRATQRRTGGIQNIRGIQPTVQVNVGGPKVRKTSKAAPTDSDWLSQQRQRQAASRQRLQQYSKKVGNSNASNDSSSGPSFTVKLSSANTFNSSNRPGFHFDAPSSSFLNSGNNRNVNNRLNNRQRNADVKNITINVSNDRNGAPQRSRQINQQRQSVAVNAMRGITSTASADSRPSTLNDRFGTSRKPTNTVRPNVGGGRTISFNGTNNNRRNFNNNRRGGSGNNNSGSGRSVLFG